MLNYIIFGPFSQGEYGIKCVFLLTKTVMYNVTKMQIHAEMCRIDQTASDFYKNLQIEPMKCCAWH